MRDPQMHEPDINEPSDTRGDKAYQLLTQLVCSVNERAASAQDARRLLQVLKEHRLRAETATFEGDIRDVAQEVRAFDDAIRQVMFAFQLADRRLMRNDLEKRIYETIVE